MFALDNREIFITVNGHPHNVVRVEQFPDSVLLEPQSGKFFMQCWQSRTDRESRPKRMFREYQDVYSLVRGISQVMELGKRRKIPSLEELNSICNQVNCRLNKTRVADSAAIEDAKESMQDILKRIESKRTVELKEAKEQVNFAILFRDRLGRLNLGMVCARLVAVRNRFRERIENILGWLSCYAKWLKAILLFVGFHEEHLPRFHDWLGQLITEDISWNSENGRDSLTIKHLQGMLEKIAGWEFFGGWRLWAMQCQKDLKEAIALITDKKYEEAVTVLKRIQQAVKLKLIQYQIHYLLWRIDLGQVEGALHANFYAKAIEAILLNLEKVDEAGFRSPVKDKVFVFLSEAKVLLLEEDGMPRFLKAGKQVLRAAYRLI